MTTGILSRESILKLSSSKFNYWAGYVANFTLVAWLLSQAFAPGWFSTLTGPQWLVAAVVGYLTWTLGEYFLHRYAYHEWPPALRTGHGLHHDEPKALIGVPWYFTAVLIVGIFYGFAHFWSPAWVGSIMGFFWLGYIGYCAIHHSIHHHNFQNFVWKAVRRHHLVHHAKNDKNWGISGAFWDYIFRTKA